MWVDLIKAGVVKEKLDGQPNRILLELWHQLKPEQQFQPLEARGKAPCMARVPAKLLGDSTHEPGPSPSQRNACVLWFNSGEGQDPHLEGT